MNKPHRAPRQILFAPPAAALIGALLVGGAFWSGASAPFVALAGLGGLSLAAALPMALTEAFVGRPLRAALEQLRAERDGSEPPSARPFAYGVLGDILAVAADIRAGRLAGGALERCEAMLASAQAEIAALRAPAEAPEPKDNPFERIETMLVALAEAAERGETHDKQVVEALAALPAPVEALRAEIAAATEGDKAAQARLAEGLEALEKRIVEPMAPDFSEIAEIVRHEAEATRAQLPAPARIDEIAAEIARLSALQAGFDAKLAERVDSLRLDLVRFDAALRAQGHEAAGQLDQVGKNIVEQVVAFERDDAATTLTALLRATKDIRAAADALRASPEGRDPADLKIAEKLDAVSARLGAFDAEGLRQGVADLAQSLSGAFVERAQRLEERAQREADRVIDRIETLEAGASSSGIEALRGDIAALADRIAGIGADAAARVEAISQSLGADVAEGLKSLSGAMGGLMQAGAHWRELAARIETLAEAARPDYDALALKLGETAAGVVEGAARRFEEGARAQSAQLVERFAELDRGVFNAMLSAFDNMTRDLSETRARFETSLASAGDASPLTLALTQAIERFDAAAGRMETRASGAPANESETLWALASAVGESANRLDAFDRAQAERLQALEARFAAAPRARDSGSALAMAKIVRSLASALDLRFTAIEAALAGIASNAATPQELADLAARVEAAATHLKTGLTEFAAASSALVEAAA